MNSVARAAEDYRDALENHRIAKTWLQDTLRNARAKGRSVPDLARESGYSRQRIYQLIADKPASKEKER